MSSSRTASCAAAARRAPEGRRRATARPSPCLARAPDGRRVRGRGPRPGRTPERMSAHHDAGRLFLRSGRRVPQCLLARDRLRPD
jgi:hypothetical protein